MENKPTEAGKRSGTPRGMAENLKKAVSEMLVLYLLQQRQIYIGEISEELKKRSDGIFQIVFPYAIIYRMIRAGYIDEIAKRTAPDGRRRQYYDITEAGREYFEELYKEYHRFTLGIHNILQSGEAKYE